MGNHTEALTSMCRVERGLYALRYLDAPGAPYPTADVIIRSGEIEIIPAPSRASSSLRAPGQCLIVVAHTAGEFEICVSSPSGGATDAKFNLDLLDAGEVVHKPVVAVSKLSSNAVDRTSVGHRRIDHDGSEVSILAHVSRRGDVRVEAAQWVAGPNEVLPIEGLSIATGQENLGVRIRVQTLDGGHQWSRWHDAGEFAGSRQKAAPLTGIALALIGDDADSYEIVAEVMALGSPRQARSGQIVEFFGVDPIVGFRFELKPVTGSSAPLLARPATPLRVFRAKK
jgi:hypothetical protein